MYLQYSRLTNCGFVDCEWSGKSVFYWCFCERLSLLPLFVELRAISVLWNPIYDRKKHHTGPISELLTFQIGEVDVLKLSTANIRDLFKRICIWHRMQIFNRFQKILDSYQKWWT